MAGTARRVISKRAPPWGRFMACMVPCISTMIRRQMRSPRPVPLPRAFVVTNELNSWRQDMGRDAGGCVGDGDLHQIGTVMDHRGRRHLDGLDRLLIGDRADRVTRIVDQVYQHLFELAGIADHPGKTPAKFQRQPDARLARPVLGQADGAVDRLGGIEGRGRTGIAATDEVAQVLDDAARGLDLVGYAIELASHELRIGSIAALTGLCQLVARRLQARLITCNGWLISCAMVPAISPTVAKRSASFSACSASRRSVSSTPTKTTLVVGRRHRPRAPPSPRCCVRGPADPSGAG